jgi:hypothetical protein
MIPENVPGSFPPASGLYDWERSEEELPAGSSISGKSMELRLDVDGHTPLMRASGTVRNGISAEFHWIAELTGNGQDRWKGTTNYYRYGEEALFPYDAVEIQVLRGASSNPHGATATFSNGRGLSHELTFKFRSPYFHSVDFEFDYLQGQKKKVTTEIKTRARKNLPPETLTISTVFERAGFSVSLSPGGKEVPISKAGADAKWNDFELHDAMLKYWSHYAPKPQWALWVFFTSLYEKTNLYGIMFDNIGKQHRQGTAVFNESSLSNVPFYGPNPKAYVERKKFFVACHEIGHCFNLAHSWQRETPPGIPWIHQENEPEARSFMNDPSRLKVKDTEDSEEIFFADFEYRFSDSELLFMRHAPERFVEMGNALWYDDCAFQESQISPGRSFKLELRVNREKPVFEFMEPVTLELKLKNISPEPRMVEEHLLSTAHSMTVVIKRNGRPARPFIPFARYDWHSAKKILKPRKSLYESLFVSAGINGWDFAEPGDYYVQAALHYEGEDLFSKKLKIRILPPKTKEEEKVAKDFFSENVGRVLYFKGSTFLEKANDVLRDVAERLKSRKVALHASVALGYPLSRDCKQLVVKAHGPGPRFRIRRKLAEPKVAKKFLAPALIGSKGLAAETFGHINYKRYVDRFVGWLEHREETPEAVTSQKVLYETLSKRSVRRRRILKDVLEETQKRLEDLRRKNKKGR